MFKKSGADVTLIIKVGVGAFPLPLTNAMSRAPACHVRGQAVALQGPTDMGGASCVNHLVYGSFASQGGQRFLGPVVVRMGLERHRVGVKPCSAETALQMRRRSAA